jgi:uncharacterized integral membrane protein
MSFETPGDAPERAEDIGAVPPDEPLGAQPDISRAQRSDTNTIPKTRTARAHNALIAGAIVLILLLVFILENTRSVKISYFGAGFKMPLGVALLLAAIGGALLVGIVGTARIVQLRRRVRHPR